VGVFVDQPVDFVNDVADRVGLGVVQLHGDEPPDAVHRVGRPVVKAIRRTDPDAALQWPSRVLLLVDADDPERRGGTGTRADWTAAARLAVRRPILLAGGITPENAAQASLQVRPFGLDVSSGVELSPGVKDAARMRSLFDAIQAIEREMTAAMRDGAR
jgi:phosphoribosylanthranilate isomerase